MNSLDTSNIILSSLLTAHEFNNINLDVLMTSGISKHWFITEVQKDIFEVINTCYKANRPFDEDTIISHLVKAEVQNPHNIILDLLAAKQVPQNIILEHISLLRVDYHKRILFQLNTETNKMLNDDATNPEVITQMIQNTLNNFEFLNNKGFTRSLSEVRKDRKSKPPVTRLKTDVNFIDTVLTGKNGDKGIRNEGLFFISGLKQSGKTFIATRIIENVSKIAPVLFGSLEFGEDLYDEGIEEAQDKGNFVGDCENIYTFDNIYCVDKICAEIRFQHKLNGIKLAVLDSMMRITNNDPNLKTDERRISDMFSKLGKLSKELKIPIIIIVQSSKEDLKSSIVSVKGSMNADHEAYVWFHLFKTDSKNPSDERRTVIWIKNKDTHKHPKQHLMFVPQTKDFYQFECDDKGFPAKELHKYRKPKFNPAKSNYENIGSQPVEVVFESDTKESEMPHFEF